MTIKHPAERFGIGDIISGNFRNSYGVTKRGTKHLVIDTDYKNGNLYEDIKVRVIEGVDAGFEDWVSSQRFDLVERAKQKESKPEPKTFHYPPVSQYTMQYDKELQTTFVRVGDVTIAVPVEEKFVSITVKHPEDVECDEIAKAVAYYRLAKGVK